MHLEAAPPFVLAITYWLHMLATVVWIGGLAALSLIVIPSARRTLDQTAYSALLHQISNRLQQVGWLSLGVLIATGMFQMSSSPSYKGLLAITNPWAVAIFSKHLVVGLMIVTSAYVTWGLVPALNRIAFLEAAGKQPPAEQAEKLRRRETWMLRANLGLSVLVLLLTAWARTSV